MPLNPAFEMPFSHSSHHFPMMRLLLSEIKESQRIIIGSKVLNSAVLCLEALGKDQKRAVLGGVLPSSLIVKLTPARGRYTSHLIIHTSWHCSYNMISCLKIYSRRCRHSFERWQGAYDLKSACQSTLTKSEANFRNNQKPHW